MRPSGERGRIAAAARRAHRIAEALRLLGAPLAPADVSRLDGTANQTAEDHIAQIQAVLDPLCLAAVEINAESRVKATRGAAPAELIEQGWRVFLVKVHNEAGVTAALRVSSPNAAPILKRSTDRAEVVPSITPADLIDRWCDVKTFDTQPLNPTLSGLEIEYRVVEIFSRGAGKREAKLLFDIGQGTQDLGFRSELNVLFDCSPAVEVLLHVKDEAGEPAMASFTIRDSQQRLYPSPARRLAPDLFFQDQIYRADGETVLLPPGEYSFTYGRGPEYRLLTRTIQVPDGPRHEEDFALKRWIKLADHGWYSGDHHVHAAGCAHYESPTEGVRPEDMMRQILGEDLNVGCVLSWGPCWYFQKQFFQAKMSELSTPHHLMRYDIEVSGFPSSHAGHLCLLRPQGRRLSWHKAHRGVAELGPAHPAMGQARKGLWSASPTRARDCRVDATRLPTDDMPPFDGIGANEYIVDATHGQCDFISTVDTPSIWELNIWYHTLNCGLTTQISGETDFPCVYGERLGLGRSYVKLEKPTALNYEAWLEGLRNGRSYVSDGTSHLFDFRVGGLGVGEPGDGGRSSVLAVPAGKELAISVNAAALLAEQPRDDIRKKRLDEKPYWHVERARIGDTNTVAVELIVNGQVMRQKPIVADGTIQPITFRFTPDKSSWIAVRIFPSAHTNPVFVEARWETNPRQPGQCPVVP